MRKNFKTKHVMCYIRLSKPEQMDEPQVQQPATDLKTQRELINQEARRLGYKPQKR